jgi:hypothetical protein
MLGFLPFSSAPFDSAEIQPQYFSITNESAATNDILNGFVVYSSSLSESTSVLDSGSAQFTGNTATLNSATGSDSPQSSAKFFVNLSESALAVDEDAISSAAFSALALNFAMGSDSFLAGAVFQSSTQQLVIASDQINARYLWEPVDDDQTTDWDSVNDTQSAGWAEIDDGQIANWAAISDNQTAGWLEVDDDQESNWGVIGTDN